MVEECTILLIPKLASNLAVYNSLKDLISEGPVFDPQTDS